MVSVIATCLWLWLSVSLQTLIKSRESKERAGSVEISKEDKEISVSQTEQ